MSNYHYSQRRDVSDCDDSRFDETSAFHQHSAAQAGQTQLWQRPPSRQAPRCDANAMPEAIPSPAQEPYRPQFDSFDAYGSRFSSRASSSFAAALLYIVAVLARVGAWCFSILVVSGALAPAGSWRLALIRITSMVTSWMPASFSGVLVFRSPFGGVIRGDFIIVALLLFIIDWLCLKQARSLKGNVQ